MTKSFLLHYCPPSPPLPPPKSGRTQEDYLTGAVLRSADGPRCFFQPEGFGAPESGSRSGGDFVETAAALKPDERREQITMLRAHTWASTVASAPSFPPPLLFVLHFALRLINVDISAFVVACPGETQPTQGLCSVGTWDRPSQ